MIDPKTQTIYERLDNTLYGVEEDGTIVNVLLDKSEVNSVFIPSQIEFQGKAYQFRGDKIFLVTKNHLSMVTDARLNQDWKDHVEATIGIKPQGINMFLVLICLILTALLLFREF